MTSMAILVVSARVDVPEQAATLFLLAQSYAALDAKLEIYFAAQSVGLLTRRNQPLLLGYGTNRRSLSDHLGATLQEGVSLFACSQAMQGLGLVRDDLIAEINGLGGVVQFAARSLESDWHGLVF